MFMRFISVFVFVLFSGFAAFAGDPYTIANVHVDATASSALEAQTLAISQGQARAANMLVERMSLASERAAKGFTGVSARDGSKMIRALEIANEKRSASRYLGDITVAFNQNAIAQYMRAKGLTLVTSQARSRLVIPLLDGNVLWSGNDWENAWQTGNFSNALTPMQALTPRAGLEQLITDPYGLAISKENLLAIGQLFNVQQIVIARARSSYGEYDVTLTDISLDSGERRTIGGIKAASASAAALASVSALETEWKASAVSSVSSKSVLLPVSVLYNSHNQWQMLQDAINGSAQIRTAQLKAVSKRGALMELTFGGDMEKLRRELSYKGVSVKTDDVMGVVLFKAGTR